MRSRYQLAAGVWGIAVLVAALTATPAAAQTAPAPGTDRKYTNKTEFNLPITITDRANLREVRLLVKTPTSEWQVRETVGPAADKFIFRTTQDGEFWFNVVTVDKNGSTQPADVTREQPQVIVVVDTQPPQVSLT